MTPDNPTSGDLKSGDPTSDDLTSDEQFHAEVRQAVRYERGLAVKALIALGVVALIVMIRLLVV